MSKNLITNDGSKCRSAGYFQFGTDVPSVQPDVLLTQVVLGRRFYHDLPKTKTAQGFFVNFLNVQEDSSMKVPFG